MRKGLKYFLGALAGLLLVLGIVTAYYHEDRPKGVEGKEAEALTDEVLAALNNKGWEKVKLLQWNFRGKHYFLWDKTKNVALIRWDNHEVILDLSTVQGRAKTDGKEVEGSDKDNLVQKAWAYWCNDSFWMFAPFKLRDPGTKRSIVTLEDGSKGLMITYEGGGVTPGDSYLWLLGPDKIPTGYKMWVKIIPAGGTYMSWENWVTLPSGAKVATYHKNDLFDLKMEEVKEGTSYKDFGYDQDPFSLKP